VTVLIAVICVAWLTLALLIAVVLGRALHHADAADRGRLAVPATPLPDQRPAAGSRAAR
jgi:hypothetical protein